MSKKCFGCGCDIMKCLKTGLLFTYKDEIRTGDLFGCPLCGTITIFGIPGGRFSNELSYAVQLFVEHTDCAVPESVTYPYAILHDVKFQVSKDFDIFMKTWNFEFHHKYSNNFPIIGE